MHQRHIHVGLVLPTQTFQNHSVCSLAVEFDLAVRTSNNGRHSFPGAVELEHVQDEKFLLLTIDLNKDRLGFARLMEMKLVSRSREQDEQVDSP